MYKENPKTKGSGIMCAIPQTGTCPNKCEDCFFQSGRSYLEPLKDNLPNMPHNADLPIRPRKLASDFWQVIRVNDGNDSNNDREAVIEDTLTYSHKFYNTAVPDLDFKKFVVNYPVVLTINPGKITDVRFHLVSNPSKNLMFVRFRVNTWNLELCDEAVKYYSGREIPIILTFMAYHNEEAEFSSRNNILANYIERKRTLNSYWAITTKAWRKVMQRYEDNKWVHSCGKIEGEKGDTHCRFCGNCLREYFATLVRMDGE